ncbi:hypothetical protein [Fortiea contorta]|uniref:hypothetical protein n=1 Tax=Fortiea contorta TaxID=1892405 RepID=UPI00034D8374|nr:hypothetical protein [Fortiea contorta]
MIATLKKCDRPMNKAIAMLFLLFVNIVTGMLMAGKAHLPPPRQSLPGFLGP